MHTTTKSEVQLVDHMGNDDSVVNAARVSFNKMAENFTKEQNEKLIMFLAEHKHEIPFAHTAITLRVKAPISIRTQCFKSKIGFVENEVSRRYVSYEPELFIPQFRAASANKKQGSGDELEAEKQVEAKKKYEEACKLAIETYNSLIDNGVAPEQARFVLPQGVLTEWVWTGSLLAFARFYNLRYKPDAQKEIQEVAQMVGEIMEKLFPISWKALTKQK